MSKISQLTIEYLNEILEQDAVYLADLITQKASKDQKQTFKKRVAELKFLINHYENKH